MRNLNECRGLWMRCVVVGSLSIVVARVPLRAQPPLPPSQVSALGWDADRQGHFVLSMGQDGTGQVWVGTEDKGVWRYNPQDKQWTQYTTRDGLGDDDAPALAVDTLNRVWVGHLNHGVSVWNGRQWQNYGALDGPCGDRVFAIAVCPRDGDVWIATDGGVTRFSRLNDAWSYYTRAEGLPADQVQAIAFDPDGNVLLGTQSDGLAMARAADGYRTWRTVVGPARLPMAAAGQGLPGNLINDVLVADGTVYVATPNGLGRSHDGGQTWSYLRGEDWEENVRGLLNAPEPVAGPIQGDLLLEDWITCLRQDPGGNIWLGHLRKGFEVRRADTFDRLFSSQEDVTDFGNMDYVRAVLNVAPLPPLLGYYSGEAGGVRTLRRLRRANPPPAAIPPPAGTPALPQPPLPRPAPPPGAGELTALRQRLDGLQQPLQPGEGAYLTDDWRTWGDWVGRYGREYASLCGMGSPLDHMSQVAPAYNVQRNVGPHQKIGGPYTYISALKTENPRVLYDPVVGSRRQAEANDGTWDDQAYPFAWDGPDLWLTIQVPAGVHRISLHFFNKDAHVLTNKYRDFPIELWREAPDPAAEDRPPLARARVRDFWGPVYKQFLVCGPGPFLMRIGRNHSHGVTLNGVFIDRLPQAVRAGAAPASWMGDVHYDPPPAGEPGVSQGQPQAEVLRAAADLWARLDGCYGMSGGAALQWPMRLAAYRAAVASGAPAAMLSNWRWHLRLWSAADRTEFNASMARAYQSYAGKTPAILKNDRL